MHHFFTFSKLAVALLLAWAIIMSAVNALSQDSVVAEITAAVRAGDAQALEDRVNWDDLREQLKESLTKQAKLLKAAGLSSGPSVTNVDKIVDHYAQPDKIPVLLGLKAAFLPEIDPDKFIRSYSYTGPASFKVVFWYPREGRHAQYIPVTLNVTAVFKLDGFTWKVHELQVPAPLVPSRIVETDNIVNQYRSQFGVYNEL